MQLWNILLIRTIKELYKPTVLMTPWYSTPESLNIQPSVETVSKASLINKFQANSLNHNCHIGHNNQEAATCVPPTKTTKVQYYRWVDINIKQDHLQKLQFNTMLYLHNIESIKVIWSMGHFPSLEGNWLLLTLFPEHGDTLYTFILKNISEFLIETKRFK